MNNKHFMRDLRLTMPTHYHSRRTIYTRPERGARWDRVLMVMLVVSLFVGGLPW